MSVRRCDLLIEGLTAFGADHIAVTVLGAALIGCNDPTACIMLLGKSGLLGNTGIPICICIGRNAAQIRSSLVDLGVYCPHRGKIIILIRALQHRVLTTHRATFSCTAV